LERIHRHPQQQHSLISYRSIATTTPTEKEEKKANENELLLFQKRIESILEKIIQTSESEENDNDDDLASLFKTWIVHTYRSSPSFLHTHDDDTVESIAKKHTMIMKSHRFVIAKAFSHILDNHKNGYEFIQQFMQRTLSNSERMNFLLELRTDLRHWMHDEWKQEQPQYLWIPQLEHHLQKTLKEMWAPSSTRTIQRITFYETAAAILELIEKKEAVHPVVNLQDLRDTRLGPNKRVYGLFHKDLQMEIPPSFQLSHPVHTPAVVVHTSLNTFIPSHMTHVLSIETIQSPQQQEQQITTSAASSNIHTMNETNSSTQTTTPDNPIDATHSYHQPYPQHPYTVATFYSITNLHPGGLAGVGLGEYLLKEVIQTLQTDIPTLDTFVTLSPIPGFRKWIQELHDGYHTNTTITTANNPWWKNQYAEDIAQTLFHCHPDQLLEHILQLKYEQFHHSEEQQQMYKNHPSLRHWLMGLAARYLAVEKQGNHHHHHRPRNPVTRFHISNGAEMYRINYDADPSKRGFWNSFGIMVNYRYVLSDLQINQQNYHQKHHHHHPYTIPLHENVSKILASQNF
jgi:malonyl-CoA decarboxylase